VLACKALKVSDFSGRSVGTLGSSNLAINPNIPEVTQLAGWYITPQCPALVFFLCRPFAGTSAVEPFGAPGQQCKPRGRAL